MNKKILTTFLIILVFLLIVAAVFIGIRLSTTTTTPEDIRALPSNIQFTTIPCSGSCESGDECNDDGDPPVGKMWACYIDPSVSSYRCAYVDINEGGSSCYLDCDTGWSSCGCDEDLCIEKCLESIGPGESNTYTMDCDNCGQEFTCECSLPEETPTPTPTPSGSPTPSVSETPTPTPSDTSSPTPTLPITALVSDEADSLIIGVILIIIGIGFYRVGVVNIIEKLMWNFGGRSILGEYNTEYFKEKINDEREDFEDKIIKN